MMQYIDKAVVVAEIERIKNTEYNENFISNDIACCALDMAIDAINTLETKEVDLEEEFCNYLEKNFRIGITGMLLSNNGEPINTIKLFDFAKHFFELGLKAQKGK